MIRTHRQVLAGLVLAGGILSACTSPVGGLPQTNQTQHAVPGTLDASFLTPDQVSTLVGVTLSSDDGASEPPSPLAANPATCAVAIGPATQTVYTIGWTVFGSTTYADSTTAPEHTVTQVLGRYPDSGQAGAVFRALADGLKGCPSAVRTDVATHTTKWTYSVATATPDTLAWTATQDAGDGWACYRQARLKGTAVLQVAVCQVGDGGPAAAKIADQFTGRVTG